MKSANDDNGLTGTEPRKAALAACLAMLPTPDGKPFATVFEHGSLLVEIFAPRGIDTQQPHSRDEAYLVIRGEGEFVNGENRFPFTAGDFLFAAAGEVHRFENFSDDFVTWVIFYGPQGGEKGR